MKLDNRSVKVFVRIALVLFLAGFAQTSRAQWVSEVSAVSSTLHSVVVASNTTAGASGDNATMLWTTNSGATWLPYVTTFPGNYLGMCFGDLDGNSVYLVGDMPGVVYTEDDGITWAEAKIPTTATLNAISFLLADSIGIAVGNQGTIIRSTDYGATWKSITTNVIANLYAVTLYGSGVVDAVGANGTWIESSDYGLTWQDFGVPTTNALYGFDFDQFSETGWIVGNSVILKTTDYGNSWVSQTFSSPSALNSVSLTDSITAYIAGNNGRILSTVNGTNWIDQATNTTHNLNSIQLYSADTGWAVGASGTILTLQRTASVAHEDQVTNAIQLQPNYPNPFEGATTIAYELPARSQISLRIYDELGRVVATLYDGVQDQGSHQTRWDASQFPAGLYLCKLAVGNSVLLRQLVLTK